MGIPVVVISSYIDKNNLQMCYDNGVNSYISKPANFDEFSKMVVDIAYYWLYLNVIPFRHDKFDYKLPDNY